MLPLLLAAYLVSCIETFVVFLFHDIVRKLRFSRCARAVQYSARDRGGRRILHAYDLNSRWFGISQTQRINAGTHVHVRRCTKLVNGAPASEEHL